MGDCQSKPYAYCRNCEDKVILRQVSSHRCWKINQTKPILENKIKIKKITPEVTENLGKRSMNMIRVKEPIDQTHTVFHWKNRPNIIIMPSIKDETCRTIQKKSFLQKLAWCYGNFMELKSEEKQTVKIDKEDLFSESMAKLNEKNIHKDLNIKFQGEKWQNQEISLKEWLYLITREIFAPKAKIFEECETDQLAFRLSSSKKNILEKQSVEAKLSVLGFAIGKAILQKIPIKCNLSRTILRHISRKKIRISDVYSHNKQLYEDLILALQNSQQNNEGSASQKKKMMKNVSSEIQLKCTTNVRESLQVLLCSLYKVIPAKYFSIFQPHELDMVINGNAAINVYVWRQNTKYDGYSDDDQLIHWFWSILLDFTDEKRETLLYFWTGQKRFVAIDFTIKKSQSRESKLSNLKERNTLEFPEFELFFDLEKQLQKITDDPNY